MPPNGFDRFAQHSQTSFAPNMPNISTSNSVVDQVLSMLMSGTSFAPRPGAGQSVMDAYMQRERSQQYLQALKNSFSTSLISSKLGGIDTNSGWGSMAAMLMGNPDGFMNHPFARAFNGGNPVKAQMALMANMTGITNYMGTGRIGNASFRDTSAMMDGATRSLFDTKVYDEGDVAKVKAEQQRRLLSGSGRERYSELLDGKGNLDFNEIEKIKKKVEKIGIENISKITKLTADEYTKAIESGNIVNDVTAKIGQVVATRFNFNKSSGFELQDLTKSFSMTQDLGLFDHRRVFEQKMREAGIDPTKANAQQRAIALGQAHQEYLKNAPGVLRAVSDLVGTETAEESTTALNDLFSNKYSGAASRIDVNADAHYSEDLLRRVKSTARIAGISIDNMLGIIDQAKQLAAQHPNMNQLGGVGVIEQTLKSFNTAQTMAVHMGTAAIRQAGGMVAFTQKQIALDDENRTEPLAQGYYGLRAIIKNRAMPEEVRRKALAMLDARAADPDADVSTSGNSKFRSEMANMLGMNSFQLMRMMYSGTAVTEGMRDAAESNKNGDFVDYASAGQHAKYSGAKRFMRMYIADQVLNRGDAHAFRDDAGNKITDVDKVMQKFEDDLVNTRLSGKTLDSVFVKYNFDVKSMMYPDATDEEVESVKQSFLKTALQKRPGYKEDQLILNKLMTESAKKESAMARRLGHLQAKFMPMLAQELISGNLSKGFEGLRDNIYTEPAMLRAEAMGRATGLMNQDGSDANILAALYENRGGALGLTTEEIEKNLKAQGATPAEIAATMKQREFGSNYDAFKKLSGKATLNELLAAVRGGKAGFGKSKLAQNGVAWEDVRRAGDFVHHSGLASKDNVNAYGGNILNPETLKKMITKETMLNSLEIMERDWAMFDTTESATNIKTALDAQLGSKDEITRKSALNLKEAMTSAGFIRPDGTLDVRKIAADDESAKKVFELAKPNKMVSDELEKIVEYRNLVKSQIEDGKKAINGLGDDKQAALLESLEKTIGSSSTNLATTLASIADALKTLITVNP